MLAVVGPVWKPLSGPGCGLVYVLLVSEGATTTLAAAGRHDLFPAEWAGESSLLQRR